MDPKVLDDLEKKIGWLADRGNGIGPRDGEALFSEIVKPLLEFDGYVVRRCSDSSFDLRAEHLGAVGVTTLGVRYKHYKEPVPVHVVRELLGACVLDRITKGILVARSGFSRPSLRSVRRDFPWQIELIDVPALSGWVTRLRNILSSFYQEARARFVEAVRIFSLHLAQEIARDYRFLYEVEWRDLERIMAEVFDALGFLVTLTPSSRDGGKDLIIEGIVSGKRESYIVEIKHWKSGKQVGYGEIKEFISVVLREKRQGGLFLASSGYSKNVVEVLSEISRQRVRLGTEEKIIALCHRYVRSVSGLWEAPQTLPDLLFEDTLEDTLVMQKEGA